MATWEAHDALADPALVDPAHNGPVDFEPGAFAQKLDRVEPGSTWPHDWDRPVDIDDLYKTLVVNHPWTRSDKTAVLPAIGMTVAHARFVVDRHKYPRWRQLGQFGVYWFFGFAMTLCQFGLLHLVSTWVVGHELVPWWLTPIIATILSPIAGVVLLKCHVVLDNTAKRKASGGKRRPGRMVL